MLYRLLFFLVIAILVPHFSYSQDSDQAATDEEVLLRLTQLATGYSYYGSFGLSYTFGSIFSNVVNPRFGGY